MEQNLLLRILSIIISIIVVYAFEELICFIIIKRHNKIDNFNKYKTAHRGILLHSKYIYKNKKYLIFVKSVLIIFVILFGLFFSDNTKYYDSKNNSYKKQIDIIFYDKNGYTYSIDKDSKYFICNNQLTDKSCVDNKGFVCDINEDYLYIGSLPGTEYLLSGEIYFSNTHVYWDKDNQLHYYNMKKDYVISDYNFTVNIKTGDVKAELK